KVSQKATDIENKSEQVEGGQIVGEMKESVKDETSLYENAWAKHLMNQDLTTDERNVFAKMNNLTNEFAHTTINTPTLIPDTVVAGIEKLMVEQYPLLADVRKFNVKGNLTMNRHASIEAGDARSEEHTSELQSRFDLVCRLLLEKIESEWSR